jgi:hypothetical protein
LYLSKPICFAMNPFVSSQVLRPAYENAPRLSNPAIRGMFGIIKEHNPAKNRGRLMNPAMLYTPPMGTTTKRRVPKPAPKVQPQPLPTAQASDVIPAETPQAIEEKQPEQLPEPYLPTEMEASYTGEDETPTDVPKLIFQLVWILVGVLLIVLVVLYLIKK